jgi:hypothetical protein
VSLDGKEIKEVEVTTSVVDDEGSVLMMLVRTEERAVATRVDLETKQVTEIVRVNVPDFQPGDEQRALNVAKADSRVRELLAQGGVIGEVYLGHSIDIAQVTGPDGVTRKEGTAKPIAFLSIDLKGKEWSVAVDLDEAKVMGIGKPSAATLVADWSQVAFTILNPLMVLLGILILIGLALRNKLAGTVAGVGSIMFGVLAMYGGLYAFPVGRAVQFLALGVPVLGLVMGITIIRRRATSRWAAITGVVFCSLALVLDSISIIAYPDRQTWIIFVTALVIAGIIAYALYDQIRKIPRKLWWPVLIAGAAAVILALAIVQPWSVNPQGVIAKAYSATEGLLSYRTSSSITYTHEGETTTHSSEWEYVAPDRGHGKLTLGSEAFEFIIIGDKQYVREPDGASGNLFSVAVSISGSTHSKAETLRVLDLLVKIENLPDERISGVDCFHLQGEVDLQRRAEKAKAGLDPTDPRYEEMVKSIDEQIASEKKEEVEVWIGKEDYLIRQVKHEGQSPSGDGSMDTFIAVVKYYEFNRPIVIEPPLDAEGKLLPEWHIIDVNANQDISGGAPYPSAIPPANPPEK